MNTLNNKEIIKLSEPAYSFYTAGIVRGRVEALQGVVEQLQLAIVKYTELADENTDPELVIKLIQSFSTSTKLLEDSIPNIEKDAVVLFTKAIEIEYTTIHKPLLTRLSNAFNGLRKGWRE